MDSFQVSCLMVTDFPVVLPIKGVSGQVKRPKFCKLVWGKISKTRYGFEIFLESHYTYISSNYI